MVLVLLLLNYALTILATGGTLGISQDLTGEGYFHWSSDAVHDDDTATLFPDDKALAAVVSGAVR